MGTSRLQRYVGGLDMVELIETEMIDSSKFMLRAGLGDIHALSSSIRSKGLLQPLVVRPTNRFFELVVGHRRFEACRRLGLSTVPCIVKELSEKDAIELSLVENVQRETLDPIDEAKAYKKYFLENGWGGVTELAAAIGRSEEYVSHKIALLSLPKSVLAEISRRRLNPSVAYELHQVRDSKDQEQLARMAIEHRLSLRKLRLASKLVNDGLAPFEACRLVAGGGSLDHNEQVLQQVVLALKMCLLRLDALARGEEDSEIHRTVLGVRFSVHSLIDECLGSASASRHVLRSHEKEG